MRCQPAIASMSLGRAWVHDLRHKLEQASQAGFRGIEIFYEDLEYEAKKHDAAASEASLLHAAADIKAWCDELGLVIIGLQPFLFYEGLIDREEHARRIEKLKVWFQIVRVLGTDIIQIPTNFMTTGITGDRDVIMRDMLEVAELGLQQTPVVRFAYEALAWGTHVDTWDAAWEIITRVDRPNFGTCLDSFNIVGRVWADPAADSGTVPNADEALAASLAKMVKEIDMRKVFYFQVVDAERMASPIRPGHEFYVEGQPARMSWSRNARLFACEGGYLPIERVVKVLLEELGYEGWVSMELFSRTMNDPAAGVPRAHAQRGMKAWGQLVKEFALE